MKIKKFATYVEKNFVLIKIIKNLKKMQKVRDHCHDTGKYRAAAHSNCNLSYKIPREIHVVFHNGSNYHYHFIIKQLVREFKGNFDCLEENTEKYITFSVAIKKIKFIDSCRFMQDSLSNLVDNLSGIDNKEPENEFINYTRSMISSLSRSINKISKIDQKISQDALIEKFPNTYQVSNKDLNKFALLLRKSAYPYEYMDSWKSFKEESLPDKESFYSKLNNEHITDEGYVHAQKVRNTFKIKNIGEYHELYVQSDASLLADVFENFRDKCMEIYKLDPAHFLSAPGKNGKNV